MDSKESGGSEKPERKSFDYLKWMIWPFIFFLLFFMAIIAFSHWAFPKLDTDTYKSDRKEISKICRFMNSNYELRYTLTFDSLRISADKSINPELKKRELDSISEKMRLVENALLVNQLKIDSLMENADRRVAANLQKQVEHMETISGWWVSIVAGVATIIALCLAIQQNAGYQELKGEIKDKISEMDAKMAEIDEYIGKQKLLKSLQLLESISALCHYNSRTDDKQDLFRHVRLLLVRASNRFEEFEHLTHAETSQNLTEDYRIPLVMVIQQMEGILRQLQGRFTRPLSLKIIVQNITKLKSYRKDLNSGTTISENELKGIIMSLKGAMGSLSDILSAEITF